MIEREFSNPFYLGKFKATETASKDLILKSGARIEYKDGCYLIPASMLTEDIPLTLSEAAKMLGISRQGAYKLYANGKIRGEKVSGLLQLNRKDVERRAHGSSDVMA